jgi:galactose-1-phosphate uridylyltransferase
MWQSDNMDKRLSRKTLDTILQAANIDLLTFENIETFFLKETGIDEFKPDGQCQVDPRNGDRIVFNSARASRPHDNIPIEVQDDFLHSGQECVICDGKTTGVLDVTTLSDGYTFTNMNLFPILYPSGDSEKYPSDLGKHFLDPNGMAANGLHFLQWTSNYHDVDWQNMDQADRVIVLKRLAALEQKLLASSSGKMPQITSEIDQIKKHGYVSIIKNYGRLVGGSLAHSHQQIAFGNIMPRRVGDHVRFVQQHGDTFASHLLRVNPVELLIRDYGPAVLLVPYFMRRPYDMFLVLKDTNKSYLHELNETELRAVADGWHDGILAIHRLMVQIDREVAYNVITNNGPGAGLYFEFLPYTQEIGGMEHLGLYSCQGNPSLMAHRIRSIFT